MPLQELIGKIGTWQMLQEVAEFFTAVLQSLEPNVQALNRNKPPNKGAWVTKLHHCLHQVACFI